MNNSDTKCHRALFISGEGDMTRELIKKLVCVPIEFTHCQSILKAWFLVILSHFHSYFARSSFRSEAIHLTNAAFQIITDFAKFRQISGRY